jgi:nondiscriminating aspartyl-tRNA synthetase
MRTLSKDISQNIEGTVTVSGWIHKIRKLGGIAFLVIRDRSGLVQCVAENKQSLEALADLSTESVVSVTGKVVKEERAVGGAEIHVSSVELISKVAEDVPVELNKKTLNVNLDTLFDNRQITLRAPGQRAIFKVQSIIVEYFREFLRSKGFTEINTPKIVEEGLETGGAEMFDFKYFGKKAYLSQSPQMYKQIMVGVFERVFETAYIYRAEKHSTSRHLNEYLSLDLEMGFINSWQDIIDLETEYLHGLIQTLETKAANEIAEYGLSIPKIPKVIPQVTLTEAQKILEKHFDQKCLGDPDLEPIHEKQLCEYSLKELGSDFIYITHYPSKKRPFYAMDDPKNPKETLSFDLLFRGVEITTGGQRMHLYQDYLTKMKGLGMDPKNFEDYLVAFRYGMPPHGGLAIGTERITAKFFELDNAKGASLFPRDLNRLRP